MRQERCRPGQDLPDGDPVTTPQFLSETRARPASVKKAQMVLETTTRHDMSTTTSRPGDVVAESLEALERSVQQIKSVINLELREAMAYKLNNPGHGAVDVEQEFLTLGRLKDKINNVMNNTLNDWINQVKDGIPQVVLPSLMLFCQKKVQARNDTIKRILFPNGETPSDLMRAHLCKNYRVLFYLAPGPDQDRMSGRVLEKIKTKLLDLDLFSEDEIASAVHQTDLEIVAKAYMEILVHISLQDPPVTLHEDECERPQTFDPKHHANPVDGGSLEKGDACIVVFPAIFLGGQKITPSFTLECAKIEDPTGYTSDEIQEGVDATEPVEDTERSNQVGSGLHEVA